MRWAQNETPSVVKGWRFGFKRSPQAYTFQVVRKNVNIRTLHYWVFYVTEKWSINGLAHLSKELAIYSKIRVWLNENDPYPSVSFIYICYPSVSFIHLLFIARNARHHSYLFGKNESLKTRYTVSWFLALSTMAAGSASITVKPQMRLKMVQCYSVKASRVILIESKILDII